MKLLIFLLWRSEQPYCLWRTLWIRSYWRCSVVFMVLPGTFSIIPARCLKFSHESYHIPFNSIFTDDTLSRRSLPWIANRSLNQGWVRQVKMRLVAKDGKTAFCGDKVTPGSHWIGSYMVDRVNLAWCLMAEHLIVSLDHTIRAPFQLVDLFWVWII